jgi:signal transduction histidine kinase
MAPAVPFALLGVVQLLAVAGWIGLAGAAAFPRLRRRITPLFSLGALALAVADGWTAVEFGSAASDRLAWLRLLGLLLLAVGALGGSGQSLAMPMPAEAVAGVVVPLGAGIKPAVAGAAAGVIAGAASWWRGLRRGADRLLGSALAIGFVLTGVAAALADPARSYPDAGIAVLAARAAATLAIAVAVVLIARTSLLGKLTGAILAGVVAMAAGAVGIVGNGVADQVQSQQSQRLLQVAQGAQQTINALSTRAALNAQVVVACVQLPKQCLEYLKTFSDEPDYFGVIVSPNGGAAVVSQNGGKLSNAALVQLSGSAIVRAALKPTALPQSAAGGALLLPSNPPVLAIVEAAPGRPGGSSDARLKPNIAGVYGVGIVDAYLKALSSQIGYDLSLIANDQVIASNLSAAQRGAVVAEARTSHIERLDAAINKVVAASGNSPTAAFVALTEAGNGDVRVATLAVTQPAGEALQAQRSVLQRMFLTALGALIVVMLLAIALAQRIADPVRRLTVAAGRVRHGDLESTTSVKSRDEVGLLARAFDAMTSSLRTATDELRTAARQEAALRERLETVVESMSDGLVVTDPRGRITTINATAAALLHVDVEPCIGKALRDVLDVVDDSGRSLLDATADGRTVEGRLRPAGSETGVPVRYGSAPLGNRQGRVIVISDRSRENDIERMKTEFLSNVSHELRTPLTPIRGYAELLARRTDLSKQQVGTFVEEILTSTARMSRVVELLVDVAALEGGRVTREESKASVRSLVDGRLQAWKNAYPDRSGDFRRRVGTKLPAVDIDVRWVNRALDELADNAVKYTPRGTQITLTAVLTDDERHVRVSVRDKGPGFDPARAAELMGDFAQADPSETRRVGGMGLGLGFVNRVADRFDLHFMIEAEAGEGADFALLLPVWTAPPAQRRGPGSRASTARAASDE